MNRRQFAALGAATILAPSDLLFRAHRRGRATRLGQPSSVSSAEGLNDAGHIVGWSLPEPAYAALLWEDGAPVLLDDPLGHLESLALDINNAGQIVGYSTGDDLLYHAVLWDRGQATVLPGLDPRVPYSATAINASGQIVGNMLTDTSQAILWQESVPNLLEPLPGDTGYEAMAINDVGQIVGWSAGPGRARPMVWDQGQASLLPTPSEDHSGRALGINRKGQVVGHVDHVDAETGSRMSVAVWWERSDNAEGWVLTALAKLPDQDVSASTVAIDINDAGKIVGIATSNTSIRRAVLWADGVPTELGAAGPDAETLAQAINAAGQVVGAHKTQAVTWIDGELVALPLPNDDPGRAS